MKVNLTLILLLAFANYHLTAQTTIDYSPIDGEVWTAENSPYIITVNLVIDDLTIEAGVVIQFESDLRFEVEGVLQAKGVYSDSIFFKPTAENSVGWDGIKFKASSIGDTLLYCCIEGTNDFGIKIEQSTPVITNCSIVKNVSDGLSLKDTDIDIKNCIISHNVGNGVFLDGGQINISNSIIAGNSLSGIFSKVDRDIIQLLNSVIADNQDKGIDCEKGALSVKNSIIYDNSTQIFWNEQTPDITYSDIEGVDVYPGTGNLNLLPEFVDHTSYILSEQSPCIDTGDPLTEYEDKYFPPSLGGTRNDMGAYGGPEACGWYPPLYIKPPTVDFGAVSQDSSRSTIINILNYRNTEITVSEILFAEDSLQVFSSNRQNFSLPVLDSIDLTITFTPNNPYVFLSDLFLNTVNHGDVSLSVQGEGINADIQVLESELNFATVTLGDSANLYLAIRNTGKDTLRINIDNPENYVYTIRHTDIKINPNSSFDSIQVTFKPDFVRIYLDSLIIKSNDPDNGRIAVALIGEGLAPIIKLDPVSMDFGSIPVFADSLLDLQIANIGNDDLFIQDLAIEGQDPDNIVFEIVDTTLTLPIHIEPYSNIIVTIRFNPIKSGLESGQLVIQYNDLPGDEVSVNLEGTGLAPALVLSQMELDFGGVPVSSDSVLNLVISNEGNEELIVQSLLITGQIPDSVVFEITDTTLALPLNIEPDSSTSIAIRFKPLAAGEKTAQFVVQSNDPSQDEVILNLSGTGLVPQIDLAATIIYFGQVPLNSETFRDLTITNSGDAALVIDSLSIVGQHPDSIIFAIVNVSIPFFIEPDSSRVISIRFKPIKSGMEIVQLVIQSNDPNQEEVSVELNGRGLAATMVLSANEFNFGQVPLNSDSVKILYIYNLGLADLFIPYDSLTITGPDAPVFTIEDIIGDITVVSHDSVEIPVRFQPEQVGNASASLRINSNDPNNPDHFVSLYGSAYNSDAASINFDPLLSSSPFTSGQAATIYFTILSPSAIDSAFVYIRQGGKLEYFQLTLEQQIDQEKWSAQIDAAMVTERGIEYYVQVYHVQRTTLYPLGGAENPNSIQVAVPQLQFPVQTKKEIYQLISIPLLTPGQDLNTLFADNLGPYDNSKYRIYDLLNGVDYTEIASMNKPLPPGKSMWLITKEAMELDISNGQSISTEQDFELHLQQGWNLIATPFVFPVNWSDVSEQYALRFYDGTDWPFVSVLEPFKGYAVNVPQDTILLIPPQEAASTKPVSTTKLLNEEWRIRLCAEAGQLTDKYNFAGALKKATSMIDNYDSPEPPPIGDFISLYLLPNEQSDSYSTDYRQPGRDGYTFTFELSSNIENQKHIRFEPENLPPHYSWIIASPEKNIYFQQEVIKTTAKQSRYLLIVGENDYIANAKTNYHAQPIEFKLEQNYPNPFNPKTSIHFQLPEMTRLSIKIFNILGQHIITLLDNVMRESGSYSIEWKGENLWGEQVSSGMYILQFSSKHYTRSIKMIIQK